MCLSVFFLFFFLFVINSIECLIVHHIGKSGMQHLGAYGHIMMMAEELSEV